jgi:hypothetical protein
MTPKEKHEKAMKRITALNKKYRKHIEALRDVADAELEAVQGKCDPCVDDGGWMYGFCTKCGVCFG